MQVTLYHNPRCSKSREALALLESRGITPEIVLYLETPPDRGELASLLRKLGIPARALLRTKESEYIDLGLKDTGLSDDALIDAMIQHPRLIERPIAIVGERAMIGRPPEALLALFAHPV
jgi:arsenate reductase